MTDPTSNLATNLKDAYEICAVEPLQGKDLDKYYIPLLEARNSEAIIQVGQILEQQKPETFCTILFTGHRGCGKSTELRRIEEKWKNQYLTIFLNAEEETDINDLEYIDIYLMVIRKVELTLRSLKITFDWQLQKNVEDWFKEVTEESEQSVALPLNTEASASLGADAPFFAKLLFKLMGVIKNSSSQKMIIRETLKKEVTRMKGDINLLLSDGLKKLRAKFPNYKGFLVIVDNLDRCPPVVSNKLFFDYAVQIRELHCSMIYTVPILARYSSRCGGDSFDDLRILPMVNIYQLNRAGYPLQFSQEGLDAVARIIEKRVDVDLLFNSRKELIELAKASGGNIRQLIYLMQRTCLTASGREHTKIQSEDVEYAIKQRQFNFERSLNKKFFKELAYVALNKEFLDEEDIRIQMLYTTAVLEYNGSDCWNYPNPLVMRSHSFIKAINNFLADTLNTQQKELKSPERRDLGNRDCKAVDANSNSMNKVKILFLAADPSDATRLRLGQELRDIREKLQLSKQSNSFELNSRESVRPGDITQAIHDIAPQIVHFSGHGENTGQLCFENVVGNAQLVEPDALAALFELIADEVKCVVLNACYSESQAKAISTHIPFVIGMNKAIGDKSAISFAVGFYKALGAGHSFEKAYKFAQVEMQLEGISEYFTPVIYIKDNGTSNL